MSDVAKHPVQTTKKSLQIVEALKKNDGIGVTELAERMEMSKSIVHNHLNTLREEGYVIKDGHEYALSLKFLEVGGYTRKQMELYSTAAPEMTKLAEKTGELVNLMVERQGWGVYLYRAKGDRATDLNTYTGYRTHLHITALGKSIMSKMPEEEWLEIVEKRGLPAATEQSITDVDSLRERLEQISQQGYAIDESERLNGVRCVAAPIEGKDQVRGAISVSAPIGRLSIEKAEDKTKDIVQDTANVIELEMKY